MYMESEISYIFKALSPIFGQNQAPVRVFEWHDCGLSHPCIITICKD